MDDISESINRIGFGTGYEQLGYIEWKWNKFFFFVTIGSATDFFISESLSSSVFKSFSPSSSSSFYLFVFNILIIF